MDHTRRTTAGRLALGLGLAVLLAAPAAAGAQSRPTVRTGGAADVTQTTATLRGTVNPNGAATTYYFEVGTTRQYGSTTGVVSAGRGRRAVAARGIVTGMVPGTTYHYRLVARNSRGIVSGGDRTVTARPQPLGLSLVAIPNPLPFGASTTLSGALTGTGNAGRAVVLQANPFPYAQGFVTTGNPQLTGPQGTFSFPLLSVPLSTQYRVVLADNAAVSSPVVGVSVALQVGVRVRVRRPQRRGGRARVRFAGRITPARDNAAVAVQRLRGGRWRNVGGTITRPAGGNQSRYEKAIRIRRDGRFRVLAASPDGAYAPNTSRVVRIRVRPR